MARLLTVGFELNTITPDLEIGGIGTSGGAALSVVSTPVRSGTYALRALNTGASGSAQSNNQFLAANGNGPYFARAYIRIADRPTTRIALFGFYTLDSTVLKGSIRLAADGSLELWDSAGKIGSSSSVLSLDTWYRVELKIFNNTGSARLELEAKIDGAAAFASTTTSTNTGGVARLYIGALAVDPDVSFDYYMDDLALNDSTGSFENDYPGEGEVIVLRPNGTGDAGDWTNTNTAIDEETPNDATDFISSGTLDAIEDVNLSATPAAMDSTDVIKVVAVNVRYNVSNATGGDPDFVTRIKASAAGTVEESAATDVNSTTWKTNGDQGNFILIPKLVTYDLPGASAVKWTKADLDTAQAGVRISTGDTHLVQVTALWVTVEHRPAVSSASSSVSLSISPSPSSSVSLSPSPSPSRSASLSISLSPSPSNEIPVGNDYLVVRQSINRSNTY